MRKLFNQNYAINVIDITKAKKTNIFGHQNPNSRGT